MDHIISLASTKLFLQGAEKSGPCLERYVKLLHLNLRIHSYSENDMPQFMINNRTDA